MSNTGKPSQKAAPKEASAPSVADEQMLKAGDDPAPACMDGGPGAASVSSYLFAFVPEACEMEVPPEGSTIYSMAVSGDITPFASMGETFESDSIRSDRSTPAGKPKRSTLEQTKEQDFTIGEPLRRWVEACLQNKEKDGVILAPRNPMKKFTFTLFEHIKDVGMLTIISGAVIKNLKLSMSSGNKGSMSIDWAGQKDETKQVDGDIPYKIEQLKDSAYVVDWEVKSIKVAGKEVSEICDSIEVEIDNGVNVSQTLKGFRVSTGRLLATVKASISLTKDTNYYQLAKNGEKQKVEFLIEDSITKNSMKITLPNATISAADMSTKDGSFVTDVTFQGGVDDSKTDEKEYTAVMFEIVVNDKEVPPEAVKTPTP